MTKKQRLLNGIILCVLAVCSAVLTGYVLEKAKPENIAAFENRFADLTALSLAAEGAALEGDSGLMTVSWDQLDSQAVVRTGVLPIQADHAVLFNVTLGGTQNAQKTHRWNHRIQMELTTFCGGAVSGRTLMEIPLESAKGRGRVYAAEAKGAADSYQVAFHISPIDETATGELTIAFWEVRAK